MMSVNEAGTSRPHVGLVVAALLLLVTLPRGGWAQDDPDAKYIARFQEHFRKVDPAPGSARSAARG